MRQKTIVNVYGHTHSKNSQIEFRYNAQLIDLSKTDRTKNYHRHKKKDTKMKTINYKYPNPRKNPDTSKKQKKPATKP